MKRFSTLLWILVATLLIVSCDKDPLYDKGDYLYENSDLTYLENFDGILIHWSEDVTEEQQEAIREIAASMVQVEGGTFTMGSNDSLAATNEGPAHQVTLSNYRIAKFTITQKQWMAIMGYSLNWDEHYGQGDQYPCTNLSMEEVDYFISKLNSLSGLNFRKPTEAEWEYAARGGKHSHGYLYSGSNNPDEVAWHQGNGGNALHWPGSLQPNELGLYDMSGNIFEWCADHYAPYTAEAQTDPVCLSGNSRVVRGGSISYEAPYARVTARQQLNSSTRSFVVGLRLAMDN